ncbi:hypothetical protein [Cohnella yongneupensis]|uniref:Uncharacterized protein n=1 Tax=Cohnella yongneupensis TaxID=425006 RepID=A0ABW0R4E2_9BACL
MDVTIMLIIVFVVMLIGFVATVMVGKSKSNQEENPRYMQKTGTKLLRLTLLYVVTIIVIVLIFVLAIK